MAEPDSTILPTPIPTSLNVTALAKREGVTRRTMQRRLWKGWTPPVASATRPRRMSRPEIAPATLTSPAIGALALVTAVALASVSGFFGIVGMTAIFAAAAIPVMVMVGVLEAAKLVTCA